MGLSGATLGSAEPVVGAAEPVDASAEGDGDGDGDGDGGGAGVVLGAALLAALLCALVGAVLVGAVLVGAVLVGAGVVGLVVPGAADEVAGALPVAVPLGAWVPDGLLLSPGDALPVAVPPGEVLPGDVLPGEVVPGDVVPGELLPGDVLPGAVRPSVVEGALEGALVDGAVEGAAVAGVVVPDVRVVEVPLVARRIPGRAGVSAGDGTDRGGDPSGSASPTGVIPVPGTPAGTGGSAAVAGPVATRTAPAYPDSHIVVTSTNSPGCGACTIFPSPRYIATWCTVDRSLGLYAQNSRSPGRRSGRSTEVPTLACSREVRGSATPAIQ